MTRTLLLIVAVLLPASAHAQGSVTDVLGFLMTNQAVPTADFERDRAAAEASRDVLSRALLVNLTSAPLTTSSGGFLYRLNPEIGTVERATNSFGSFFVERALTAGDGRASFGLSASSSRFDALDGSNLRDGTLVTVANRFRDEASTFDTASLALTIRSSMMTVYGNIGVTDHFEVGAAVPFVRVSLDGRSLDVYRGATVLQASGSASASGLGDIALRAKYNPFSAHASGVAAAIELRAPTGDEKNLLGAGSASLRVMGIGSYEQRRLGLHGNVSIVRGGISDELAFAGAAAVALHPRLTFSAETMIRRLDELHPIELVSAPHPTIAGVDTLRLAAGPSGTTLANAVAGVKWNIGGTLVISSQLGWALVKHGLTAPLTPAVGLEYAF